MLNFFFFFFKQKTAYEIMPSLVGSEMCIRDSINAEYMGIDSLFNQKNNTHTHTYIQTRMSQKTPVPATQATPAEPTVNNPNLWSDPNRVRFADLYKYVSRDEIKLRATAVNLRGSLMMVGGTLVGCLIFKALADSAANQRVFGEAGNGGEMLKMWTRNNTYDYYYNREFQKMRYLTEEPTGDDPFSNTRSELLTDLGVNYPNMGVNRTVVKRAPHYKYFQTGKERIPVETFVAVYLII
eukprot:TRINITY_DN217_c0_g2_i1.p2 TRINITY_DN217_c0_g2~~TRINITY_DN217_c0_g2_i1.p2  ORF type:complete len:239 (+),score=104.64 TRINITY_DN217_c0_g2_i1:2-718(+)